MNGRVHGLPVPPHPPGYGVTRISQQPEEADLPPLPATHLQSFSRRNHGAEYTSPFHTVGKQPPSPRIESVDPHPTSPFLGEELSFPRHGLFSPLKGGS